MNEENKRPRLSDFAIAIICITILILAFTGEPDLADAIIKRLIPQTIEEAQNDNISEFIRQN